MRAWPAVLIVDDFRTMTDVMSRLLQQIGVTKMHSVHDGHSAMERLSSQQFGLVLSDWEMEPISGPQLIEAMRRDPACSKIPAILVSTKHGQDISQLSKEYGYLAKPFAANALRREMKRILRFDNESSASLAPSSSGDTAMTIDASSQILLVDDSSTVRRVVREYLQHLGFDKIDEASDGDAALSKLCEKCYDLIVADWNMEPMNGQALLEQTRANEKNSKTRFLMMTAEAAIDKVVKARHAGVNGFIQKPFNVEALRAKIAQLS